MAFATIEFNLAFSPFFIIMSIFLLLIIWTSSERLSTRYDNKLAINLAILINFNSMLAIRLKLRSARGTFHHSPFTGKCSTISHTC